MLWIILLFLFLSPLIAVLISEGLKYIKEKPALPPSASPPEPSIEEQLTRAKGSLACISFALLVCIPLTYFLTDFSKGLEPGSFWPIFLCLCGVLRGIMYIPLLQRKQKGTVSLEEEILSEKIYLSIIVTLGILMVIAMAGLSSEKSKLQVSVSSIFFFIIGPVWISSAILRQLLKKRHMLRHEEARNYKP